jgi:hypothetical protein
MKPLSFEASAAGILMMWPEAATMRDDLRDNEASPDLVSELTESLDLNEASKFPVFIAPRHIPTVAKYYMDWADALESNHAPEDVVMDHRRHGAFLLTLIN